MKHYDYDRKAVVETDALDLTTAGVLSQYGDDDLLYPVAYFSTKMNAAELNYDIYDKELLAIIRTFKEWRPKLKGA